MQTISLTLEYSKVCFDKKQTYPPCYQSMMHPFLTIEMQILQAGTQRSFIQCGLEQEFKNDLNNTYCG